MAFQERKPGVFFPLEPGPAQVGTPELELLAAVARRHSGKARICLHPGESDPVQEMLMYLERGSYMRPHRQLSKSVSYLILSGQADLLLFGERGEPRRCLALAEAGEGGRLAVRLPARDYRALLVGSPYLLMHEVSTGPFADRDTEWAPWAPDRTAPGLAFLARCRQTLRG
jgi:cupin fold WbuC family metalloprotein